MIDPAEIQEVRLLIRYVAMELTTKQRSAIEALLADIPDSEEAKKLGITDGAVSTHRKGALRKMRLAFQRLGITSTADLLSKK